MLEDGGVPTLHLSQNQDKSHDLAGAYNVDAALAFFQYLYTPDCEWGDKWKVDHNRWPSGYLQFLVRVYEIAEEYEQPLLAQKALDSFRDEYWCDDCRAQEVMACVDVYYHPEDLVETLALSTTHAAWPVQRRIWHHILKYSMDVRWDLWIDSVVCGARAEDG